MPPATKTLQTNFACNPRDDLTRYIYTRTRNVALRPSNIINLILAVCGNTVDHSMALGVAVFPGGYC